MAGEKDRDTKRGCDEESSDLVSTLQTGVRNEGNGG